MSDPKHIIRTAITIERRRPVRSAIRPKIQLPSGRAKNPSAKTPDVFMSCAVGLPPGKNALEKYSAVKA